MTGLSEKKIHFFICVICGAGLVAGRSHNSGEILWTASVRQLSGHILELKLKAILKPEWHIYSTRQKEGGPMPTRIVLDGDSNITTIGRAHETIRPVRHFDQILAMETVYFRDSAIFTQKIKAGKSPERLSGHVEFMLCSETICMPPDRYDFSVDVAKHR